MGGSKSKEAEVSKKGNGAGNISNVQTTVTSIPGIKVKNVVQQFTLPDIPAKSQPLVNQFESRLSQLETIIRILLKSEALNFLVTDEDEFKESLASRPASDLNAFFLRECHRAVATLHNSEAHDISVPQLRKMAEELNKLIGDNSNIILPCIFMACLLTSFRAVMMPESCGDTISLKDAIVEAFNTDADSYEGSKLMDVVDDLCSDLSVLLEVDLPMTTFQARFEKIKANIGRLKEGNITADKLKCTCASIQNWIYSRHEEIEEDPNWNTITCALRTKAIESIKGSYLNLAYCMPQSLKVPYSMLYNVFRFSQNINMSVLNFDSSLFLSRVCNVVVQYYIEENTVHTQMVKTVGDLVISGRRVSMDILRPYLPNFQAVIKKLASTSNENDLVNDFDMIVIYQKLNKFHYALKDNLLFDCNDEGNTFEYKFYLSQSHIMEPDSVKIIIKSDWRYESTSCCSYLITAYPTDTLQVLLDKLSKIYSEVKDDFVSRIFSTLRVSTNAFLTNSEYDKLATQAKQFSFNASTKLSDLLIKIRDQDPCYSKASRMVDLVFFLDLKYKDYEMIFEPKNMENNVDIVEELPVKFELSNLFNLQMEIDGFKKKAATWTEEKVMNLLPNMLYVDIENINRIIEVPREVTVKFLDEAISNLGLEVSNSYRVTSFVCRSHRGTYYPVYFMPNTKDEIRGYIDGVEKISTLDKLRMDMVIGAVFQRKQASV